MCCSKYLMVLKYNYVAYEHLNINTYGHDARALNGLRCSIRYYIVSTIADSQTIGSGVYMSQYCRMAFMTFIKSLYLKGLISTSFAPFFLKCATSDSRPLPVTPNTAPW
jgi:hypothetical protein